MSIKASLATFSIPGAVGWLKVTRRAQQMVTTAAKPDRTSHHTSHVRRRLNLEHDAPTEGCALLS